MNTSRPVVLMCALALTVTACSTTHQEAMTFAPRQVLPMPDDLKLPIDKARALGVAIYLQDKASAIASDVLRANAPALDERVLGGWITRRDADAEGRPTDWWRVEFFTNEPQPRISYRVAVPSAAGRPPKFEALQPPALPDAATAALIAALQSALGAIPRPTQPINTAMIPGQSFGDQGILVYTLAASADPSEIVLGQHHRVTVSDDGRKVQRVEPLARSPLVVSAYRSGSSGERIIAPFVQHNLTPWPLETHVFASLQHGIPLMVATERGVWWVDGDRVELIATEPPARPMDLLERR